MNNKLSILMLAMLCFAAIEVNAEPPSPPSLYVNGPDPLQLSATGMSAAERAAYGLFEGATEAAEALIYATSCSSAEGVYSFDIVVSGAIENPESNQISVVSPVSNAGPLVLRANLNAKNELRGQHISVEQFGSGSLNGTEVTNFLSSVFINPEDTLMTSVSNVSVRGVNGQTDNFQNKISQAFYLTHEPIDNNIYGWGLQSVSKLDYPIEKHWQRLKSLRDKGVVERTVFVKDRLVGASPCRIVMDGSHTNTDTDTNQNLFQQKGTLTISTEKPGDPVPAFEAF